MQPVGRQQQPGARRRLGRDAAERHVRPTPPRQSPEPRTSAGQPQPGRRQPAGSSAGTAARRWRCQAHAGDDHAARRPALPGGTQAWVAGPASAISSPPATPAMVRHSRPAKPPFQAQAASETTTSAMPDRASAARPAPRRGRPGQRADQVAEQRRGAERPAWPPSTQPAVTMAGNKRHIGEAGEAIAGGGGGGAGERGRERSPAELQPGAGKASAVKPRGCRRRLWGGTTALPGLRQPCPNPAQRSGDRLLAQQTALARFGRAGAAFRDLQEILHDACRLVAEGLGTRLAKVLELQPDGRTLLVRAGVGWRPGVVGHVRSRPRTARWKAWR